MKRITGSVTSDEKIGSEKGRKLAGKWNSYMGRWRESDRLTNLRRRQEALELLGRNGWGLMEKEPFLLSPVGLLNQVTRWFGRRLVRRFRWDGQFWRPFDWKVRRRVPPCSPPLERQPHPELEPLLDKLGRQLADLPAPETNK